MVNITFIWFCLDYFMYQNYIFINYKNDMNIMKICLAENPIWQIEDPGKVEFKKYYFN